MDFPAARNALPSLEILDSVDSTNAELARRERGAPQPHLTALATLDQRGGRGRLGRTWTAPPASALAVSVLLRPTRIPAERLGLLPLLGGLAARGAVAARLPGRTVTVKWPNDVLVDGRKIAGVLAELVAPGVVVLGTGINTAMTASQLPVPTATSVAIEAGDAPDPAAVADLVLADHLAGLTRLLDRLEVASGDPRRSGLISELEAACDTIGARVAVELPGGERRTGTAAGIREDGALLVRFDGSAEPTAILAGDVTHLRYQ